ncbi:MAG: bacteriohemerythrin [Candidatus Zixiibacteriota bacterium]
MEWHDSMNIGIDEIDRQHRRLITFIHQNLLQISASKDHARAGKFIELLMQHIREHFATEERYMMNEGYDKIDYHRNKHIEMTERILSMQQRYITDEDVDSDRIVSFFDKWVIGHFRTEDQDFGRYLKSRLIRNL